MMCDNCGQPLTVHVIIHDDAHNAATDVERSHFTTDGFDWPQVYCPEVVASATT